MEGLDSVDELQGVLHVAWSVTHVFSELLSQVLGQALGWGAGWGADDGPKRGSFLVELQEPVQSRTPRTLWPQLFYDLLGKRSHFEKEGGPPVHGLSGFLGQPPESRGP
jgi:hypothetical protein